MSLNKISVKDIYKIFPNNSIMDTVPLTKVELIIEVSFKTFGQVWFTDENGRPWIREFNGEKWTKELLMKDKRDIGFSVFINNQFQQRYQVLTLKKIINDELVDQKTFAIDGDKLFEGWFKLG
jgi:hypothetical protein